MAVKELRRVSIPKTRLRQEKDPPSGVAIKISVHIGSIEVTGARETRKEESNNSSSG
jgi:hypothetical protein